MKWMARPGRTDETYARSDDEVKRASHPASPSTGTSWHRGGAVSFRKQTKSGRAVAIWRVDVAFLMEEDWKYEGSRAGEGRGGRTHTFGVKNPAERLANAIVYQAPGIVLKGGRPILANGNGA